MKAVQPAHHAPRAAADSETAPSLDIKDPSIGRRIQQRARTAGTPRGQLVDSYLAAYAQARPGDVSVVDRGRVWTAQELDHRVNQAANALLSLGVGHGDVVSWQLPNWIEAIVVHLAALRIGAVSNPIVAIYRASEITFILDQARSKVVVVADSFRGFDHRAMIDEIAAALPEIPQVLVVETGVARTDRNLDQLLDRFSTCDPQVARSSADLCLLLYTSGTTADPKGVLHTHDTLDVENWSVIDFYGLTSADAVFMPSPLAHITGVLYGMHLPPMLRTWVTLQDVWEPGEALRLLEAHRAGFMLAATPFLHGILDHPNRSSHDISALRIFACGGADVPPELIRRASEALSCHVTRVYGSTEYPTATSSRPGEGIDRCAETDGRPMGATVVSIVDAAGAPAAVGEAGEVYLVGPELTAGYLDPRLDLGSFDPAGRFATGDFGILDEQGCLTIVGRKKDIIIRGGENLSAKDVEDHVFEHPEVADVAVVGLPDPVLGERVAAFVVTKSPAELTLEGLVSWLQTRKIATQKLPELLVITDALPRTASGKIQKFKLRAYLSSGVTLAKTSHVPSSSL